MYPCVVYTRTGNTYQGSRASCIRWAHSYTHCVQSFAIVIQQGEGTKEVIAHWVSHEGKTINLVKMMEGMS